MSPTSPSPLLGDVRRLYDGALRPDSLAYTLRHLHRLFPTRAVHRGDSVLPLPSAATPLTNVRFRSGDRDYDLIDHLCLHRVSGLVVLHHGEIAFETYELGSDTESLFTSMSVVKSISTTLVGAALHDGLIRSLDDAVSEYVTELAGSAYAEVSIRDLIGMRSGVRWVETYTDPTSDRRRLLDAQLAQQPGAMLAVMADLPRAAPPGSIYNYSTGETHVVGALLRAAVGEPIADYLSRTIWAPLGMEADALWCLDAPDGLETGGSGLGLRLRDLARFGLFVLADGVIDGRRVLPDGWFAQATAAGPRHPGDPAYGWMWWPVDPAEHGAIHAGAFQALGIFGQHLYIHPAHDLVIAQAAAAQADRRRAVSGGRLLRSDRRGARRLTAPRTAAHDVRR